MGEGCLWVRRAVIGYDGATSQHVSSASWIWHHSSFPAGFIAACNSAAPSSATDTVMPDRHYSYCLHYRRGHYLQPENRGWEGQRLGRPEAGQLESSFTLHLANTLLTSAETGGGGTIVAKLMNTRRLETHLLFHSSKCFLISHLCLPHVFWQKEGLLGCKEKLFLFWDEPMIWYCISHNIYNVC